MDYGNNYGKKTFGASSTSLGVHPQEIWQGTVPCGEVFTDRRAGRVRVAGRGEGIPLGGLHRPHAGRTARTSNGIHTKNGSRRWKLAPKLWHIHVISGTLAGVLVTLSLFPGSVSPVIVIPLGILTCWCLFVSSVRIIQNVTGCRDLDRLIEEIKKDD